MVVNCYDNTVMLVAEFDQRSEGQEPSSKSVQALTEQHIKFAGFDSLNHLVVGGSLDIFTARKSVIREMNDFGVWVLTSAMVNNLLLSRY